jgi:hypothetical protein
MVTPIKALAASLDTSGTPTPSWYALVYRTKTGVVEDQLPLLDVRPTWSNIVNTPSCPWQLSTPIGRDAGGLPVDDLRIYGEDGQGNFSVAICYGTGLPSDWIAQAGPIWSSDPGDDRATAGVQAWTFAGSGLWSLFSARIVAPAGWSVPGGSSGAVASYTGSLHDILAAMLTDSLSRSSLPVDVPAALGGGTDSRSYTVGDFNNLGQELQKITQTTNGPDLVFQPYFSAPGVVRHQALIGNPYLSQAGAPFVFDYGKNLVSIKTPVSSSALSTRTYAKGAGTDPGSLNWGYSVDSVLEAAGYPLLENVDTSQTTVTDGGQIGNWAGARQTQTGRPIKAWSALVKVDDNEAPAGAYAPGQSGTYNVIGHPTIRDGQYQQRILGLANADNDMEMLHILDVSR